MIERTEAAVLKTQNLGETSRIVHVFSRQHGLLKLVARGARRPRSRFGAAFDSGNLVQAVFYRSRASDLHAVSEASIVWHPALRQRGPEHSRMVAAALEIPLRAAAPETPILALYRNLCAFLHGADEAPEPEHPGLLLELSLGALKNLGYHPLLDRCVGCRAAVAGRPAGFSLSGGGLVCHRCGQRHRDLADVSADQARWLAGWPWEGSCTLRRADALHLVRVLMSFLNYQLSERTKLRCFRLL